MGKPLQARGQRQAARAHALEQIIGARELQRRQRRGGDHRAAGERRAVVAGGEDVGQPLAGDERTDGQPAAERLCHGDRVGHDLRLLVGPQRPRAPHAALDLVEDQRRFALVAGGARGGEQLCREHVHAALTLDRLEQHRGGALVDGGP